MPTDDFVEVPGSAIDFREPPSDDNIIRHCFLEGISIPRRAPDYESVIRDNLRHRVHQALFTNTSPTTQTIQIYPGGPYPYTREMLEDNALPDYYLRIDPLCHPEGLWHLTPDELEEIEDKWTGNNRAGSTTISVSWANPKSEGCEIKTAYIQTRLRITELDKVIATLDHDGSLTLSSGSSPNDAALAFWKALAWLNPGVLKSQVNEMKQAMQEAIEICGCEGKCPRCEVLAANIPKDETP